MPELNVGVLTTATNAARGLANLVLAIPQDYDPSLTVGYQPLPAPNENTGEVDYAELSPALLFHYEGEQVLTLDTDITDHYVEDNRAVQDQIAIKPEMFVTHGFIGELNDVLPKGLQFLQGIAETLTVVDGYVPGLSTTALIAYNKAVLDYQAIKNTANAAVSAFSSIGTAIFGDDTGTEVVTGSGLFEIGNGAVQTKQQSMLQQLYGYQNSRTLFNIQTPWAILTNMAIKTVRAIQDADNRLITDFEITWKKIRVANTITTLGGLGQLPQGRLGAQKASLTSLGTSSGLSGSSLGSAITNLFG